MSLAPNITPPPPRRLLNSREAAAFICVSERTLWTIANKGGIPRVLARGSVRYDVRDLEAFIESSRQTARATTTA